MQAVEADGDWNLIRRTDGGVAKTIKLRTSGIVFPMQRGHARTLICNSIPPSMIGIRVLKVDASTPVIHARYVLGQYGGNLALPTSDS